MGALYNARVWPRANLGRQACHISRPTSWLAMSLLRTPSVFTIATFVSCMCVHQVERLSKKKKGKETIREAIREKFKIDDHEFFKALGPKYDDVKALLKGMLEIDPARRLTPTQALGRSAEGWASRGVRAVASQGLGRPASEAGVFGKLSAGFMPTDIGLAFVEASSGQRRIRSLIPYLLRTETPQRRSLWASRRSALPSVACRASPCQRRTSLNTRILGCPLASISR